MAGLYTITNNYLLRKLSRANSYFLESYRSATLHIAQLSYPVCHNETRLIKIQYEHRRDHEINEKFPLNNSSQHGVHKQFFLSRESHQTYRPGPMLQRLQQHTGRMRITKLCLLVIIFGCGSFPMFPLVLF